MSIHRAFQIIRSLTWIVISITWTFGSRFCDKSCNAPRGSLFCFYQKVTDYSAEQKDFMHRAAAYYHLFFCNKIMIAGYTQSKCQFFSKKAKMRETNRHKKAKLITFLLQRNSPKSIGQLLYGTKSQISRAESESCDLCSEIKESI